MNYVREYWRKIESGEIITSRRVKAVYGRLVREMDEPEAGSPYYFDEETGERPIIFVERFCKQSQGTLGATLELDLFQKAFIQTLFGWLERATGYRRFRETLFLVGRKNGKSTLLAALFAVPECFDSEYLWEWDTTGYPWTLSLIAPSEKLKSEIRYAKNMTNIIKTLDASGLANRIYALGYGEGVNQLTIAGVNGGLPYVEDALSIEKYGLCSTILVDSRYEVAENLKAYAKQILQESAEPYVSYEIGAIDLHRLTKDAFSRFRPGEIVRVIDDEDKINLRTRIVSVTKDDAQGDPGAVTVTLANKSQDIAGSISDLQSRALIGETYAQGSTNQQIYNFADNADTTHPATLKLYISDSVVRINKMLLNIQFEPFRAFERAVKGGGGQTTSSGGGQTTSSGGGQTSSSVSLASSNTVHDSTDNGGPGGANHNHALARGDKIALTDGTGKITGYRTFVPSGKHTHPAHAHTISPHTHTVSAHTHSVNAHTHTVSAHTHTVSAHTHTISDHTHEIQFGIYEGTRASRAVIKVDGKTIPTPASYDNIDIVAYLSKDGSGKIQRNAWHTVEILPDTMSRIVGAVFSQTFYNSRGGGDY